MVERKASLALPFPLFVLLLRVEATPIFEEEVNGINFYNMSSVLEEVAISWIDFDESIPGNVLFTTPSQLFTANIDQQTMSLIIGSTEKGYAEGNVSTARFRSLLQVYQRTNSSLLLLDPNTHVVREINRTAQESSLFAGAPTSPAYVDGSLRTCQFFAPCSLVTFDGVVFYIAQNLKPYLAVMNLSTSEGRVTHIPIATPIIRFFLDIPSSKLIATTGQQILEMDPLNFNSSVILAGSSSSAYTDGPLDIARFGLVTQVISLNRDTLLATDFPVNALRVVDLNGQITSICSFSGSGQHISNCKLPRPGTLLKYNSTLILIGAEAGMFSLGVSIPPSTTLRTQPMSTGADLTSTLQAATSVGLGSNLQNTTARADDVSTTGEITTTSLLMMPTQRSTVVPETSAMSPNSITGMLTMPTQRSTVVPEASAMSPNSTTGMLTMPTQRNTVVPETSAMSPNSTTGMLTMPTQRSTVVPEPSAISPTSTYSMPMVTTRRSTVVPEPSAMSPVLTTSVPTVPTRSSTAVPEPSAMSPVITTTMSTMSTRRSTVLAERSVAASSSKATTRTTTTEGRPRSRISTTRKASLPPVPVTSSTRSNSKIRTTIIGIGKSEDNKNDTIYILIVVPLLVILLAAIVWKVRSSRSNEPPILPERTETIDISKQPLQETTIEDKQSTAINLDPKPKSPPPQPHAAMEISLDQQLPPTQKKGEHHIPDKLEAKSTTPPKADVENSFDQQLLQAKEKSEHSIPSELEGKPETPPPTAEGPVYSDHYMQQTREGEISFYEDATNLSDLDLQAMEDAAEHFSSEELPSVPTPELAYPDAAVLSKSNPRQPEQEKVLEE